ncbi:hypothetical protein M900_0517 [Bacteriovorax sp. Seq25_V]|nr:hypothetical protein M900_0517 [Bacteriovorax sp. Seq25_V]
MKRENLDKQYAQMLLLDKYTQALGQLNTIWENGEVEADGQCKQLEDVDLLYYQCNPRYISCLIKNNILQKKIGLNLNPEYKYIQDNISRRYEFKSDEFNFTLIDSCHEAYLPQRFYPFLVNNREHTYEWDNHSKDLFIDKFQVRVGEYKDYLETSNNKLPTHLENLKDQDIVFNLSKDEMKKYCAFQGKEVLSAMVFDAGAIYPEDISDNHSRLFRAPYYPWSRKNSSSELFKIQKNKNYEIDKNLKVSLCPKVYSRDCSEEKYIHYNRENVSWMGIYEVMGGYMEYTPNIIFPGENIKLSSIYFPWTSSKHRTGMRGYWDGEGFGFNNIAWKGDENLAAQDEFKIAFRCMRRR